MESELVTSPREWSDAKRRLLEQRLQGGLRHAPRAPAIPRRARDAAAPLSFAQQRLWFFHELQPGSPLYNMPLAVLLHGRLDAGALQQALAAIVRRHEVLRTCFESRDGTPVQVIAAEAAIDLPVIDLAGRAEAESAVEALVREEAHVPFDLTRDPLLRARLWRLAPEEHVLLVTMHHIASDGWSWSVLLQELSALYRDFAAGRAPSLPPLPLQYADYAVWQRTWLEQGTLDRQLAYWRGQLAGMPGFLALPADRPRPAVQSFRGASATLNLPPATGRALQELGRREGATLFMTLLAGFLTLLHRYTGLNDLAVGTPIAGRTQRETEGLIGFFINTLVLRGDLAGDPTFRELLRRVREMTLAAFTHQDLPFEKLVEELAPERSPSHSPLVQVMFALQNAPTGGWELPGLTATALEPATGTAKFDLTLAVTETASGLVAGLEYNTDLFDAATIGRMLAHWGRLLEGVVADPDRRVSALPLLDEAERHQLLVEWNRTEAGYRDRTTASAWFEELAARSPGALALAGETGDLNLTFAQLDRQAGRVADRLRARGVGPESLVGIFMERGPAMVAAMLGVWKAGGAYVPLDPDYPADRLAFMLRDTAAPVVLASKKYLDRLPATEAEIVDCDALLAGSETGAGQDGPKACGPGNLAYVIYTSGSTGVPKGVAVTHRSLCNLAGWYQRTYGVTPADRATQLASPSFDAAVWELWPNLLGGASVHFPDDETRQVPARLLAWLADRRITLSFMPTPLLDAALAEPWPKALALRAVQAGGAQLHRRPAADLPVQIVNHYGPTEDTVCTTWHVVAPAGADLRFPPIGRPIANTQVYVLDPARQPVPIGVAGELYIGGAGLARGYLHRPDLTAERFVPHPFNPEPGARLYRTGDLVRWLADGELEFLGRLDQQVKIRGFRIELDEIETVLAQHPAVKACAVAAPADSEGGRRLAACVVAASTPPPAVAELRRHLAAKLPDYMVPATFAFRAALPLDPNGKVDRRALAAAEWTRPDPAGGIVAPRDDLERRLVEIWEDILEISPVGVTGKFFELGGHSLLAVRLLARIEKQFGRKLPLAMIFQAPTIEAFAAIMRGQATPPADSSLVEIRGEGREPPLYLVHGAGGGMFWGYSNLVRHLRADQPLYAFKSRGLDGREEWPTIRELAAHYVADLRAFQPAGPYYLGGYCFGGNVAHEMACQLQAAGAEVGLLVLLNCAPPHGSYGRGRPTPLWVARYLRNLAVLLANFLRAKPETRREYLLWRWKNLRKRFAAAAKAGAAGPQGLEVENLIDLAACAPDQRRLWEAHIRALCAHRTGRFDGPVRLFRTDVHQRYCSFDPDCGWREFLPNGVEVSIVPGAHESILEEPHVAALGAALRDGLAAAQRRTLL